METHEHKDKMIDSLFQSMKRREAPATFTADVMRSLLAEEAVIHPDSKPIPFWKRSWLIVSVIIALVVTAIGIIFSLYDFPTIHIDRDSYLMLAFSQTLESFIAIFETVKISKTAIIIVLSAGALFLIEPLLKQLKVTRNIHLYL